MADSAPMPNDNRMEVNSTLTNGPESETKPIDISCDVSIGSYVPCQVDKNLDAMQFNSRGELFMCSSNLTGRYWRGSLWLFSEPSTAPDVEKCKTGTEVNSGVADFALLTENKLVTGQDNGTVEFFMVRKPETEQTYFESVQSVREHDDAVSVVRTLSGGQSFLTASSDSSIRIWDSNNGVITKHLPWAHSQPILDVAVNPQNSQIFLSCSRDGNVLLWDLRKEKPASCLYRDIENKPLCLVWLPTSGTGEKYVIGTESGSVAVRETGNLSYSLLTKEILERPLHKLCSNPHKLSTIAICGNDSKLSVVNINDSDITQCYESNQHEDFVRGMAWQDSQALYSCGWDKKVHSHIIAA